MNYLLEAIKLAEENVLQGGRPFASVIVKENQIIATGSNLSAQTKDPTAHAEMLAIQKASQVLQSESLKGCELYTTSEPCPMCLGALYWAELDKVIFAMPGKEVAKFYPAERRYHKPSTFYGEFALPYHKRTLPMQCLQIPEGDALFKHWHDKNIG